MIYHIDIMVKAKTSIITQTPTIEIVDVNVHVESTTPSKVDVNETESTTPSKVDVNETENSNPITIYVSKLNSYVERIANMNKELKDLVSVGKTLEKDFNQIVKIMSKKTKTKNSENRPLSGFAMPSLLSEQLYDFLDLEKGVKVPRKDVTRMINSYIKDNSLRDESDRRKIIPDDELHKIFNSSVGDNITYFNLQSYMKHHFIKDNKAKVLA